MLQGI